MRWKDQAIPTELARRGDRAWTAKSAGLSYVVVDTKGFGITATWKKSDRAVVWDWSPNFIGDTYPTIEAAQEACREHAKGRLQ